MAIETRSAEAASLREEIADLRASIAGLPEELRLGPYGEVYLQRLELLHDELNELELAETAESLHTPAMNLRLMGAAASAAGRIPALLLGEVLKVWQSFYTALAQAAAGKPTSRGMVPLKVQGESALDAVAFSPGSFVVRLVVHPQGQLTALDSETLAAQAFGEFEQLVQAGAKHHDLTVAFHRLRARVLSTYSKLLELSAKHGIDVDVSFYMPGLRERRRQVLLAADAATIQTVLSEVKPPEMDEPEVVTGVLNAANATTGAFEIGLGDDDTLTGKAHPASLLHGLTIGSQRTFRLTQVVTRDPFSQAMTMSWTMDAVIPEEDISSSSSTGGT